MVIFQIVSIDVLPVLADLRFRTEHTWRGTKISKRHVELSRQKIYDQHSTAWISSRSFGTYINGALCMHCVFCQDRPHVTWSSAICKLTLNDHHSMPPTTFVCSEWLESLNRSSDDARVMEKTVVTSAEYFAKITSTAVGFRNWVQLLTVCHCDSDVLAEPDILAQIVYRFWFWTGHFSSLMLVWTCWLAV